MCDACFSGSKKCQCRCAVVNREPADSQGGTAQVCNHCGHWIKGTFESPHGSVNVTSFSLR
jgi:hypothetical protein